MAKRRKAGLKTLVDHAWSASWRGLTAVVIFSVFVNILKFATPLYLLQVLDRIPASRSIETLVMLTIITLIAVATGYALDIIRRRLLRRWSAWIEETLGPEIMRRSTHRETDEKSSGQALSDLGAISRFAGGQLVRWLDLIWAPVFVFGVFLIHPVLGWITFASVLIVILVGWMQDPLTRAARRAASAAKRDGGTLMQTMTRHRETVDALQMGGNLTEQWRRNEAGRLEEAERTASRGDTFALIMGALGQFLRIGILAAGVWLVVLDQLSIGSIFAARLMAGFGFKLVEGAVRNWRSTRESIDAYKRLVNYFNALPPKEASMLGGLEHAPLVLDAVSHRYPYQRDYLFRRLSVEIPPGRIVVLTGPAGAGKTTLARILTGIIQPRLGHVRLGDIDISRIPAEQRSGLVGYMPQHTELFDATIRENIGHMGDPPLEKVIAVAKLVGIHELMLSLPEGYDTMITSDHHGILSGSQRKRIGLARALYNAPRILVLDEPSANLDGPSRRIMEAALQQLSDEGTTIIATQAIDSPRLSRIADMALNFDGASIKVSEAEGAKARKEKKRANLRSVK
ncbi:type I secretion system permease/ATPase [Paracoccaceae bacterium GXU_MW_L88]